MVQGIIYPKLKKPVRWRSKPYELRDADDLYKMVELKSYYRVKGPIPFIEGDPQLSINIAFYQEMLDIAGSDIKLWQYAGSHARLKELSQWAQKSGPRVKQWYLLVNVEALYGWREAQLPVGPRVKQWVCHPFEPKFNGSKQEFLEWFERTVTQVLDWKDGMQEADLTLKGFCQNVVKQGTTGSAYDPGGRKLDVTFDGQHVKCANNKFSKSLELSPEEKERRWTTLKKQKCRVSRKIEFYPKERLIVSADYDTTEKMRYIDTWLTGWMKGNPNSTLWQSNEDAFKMWVAFGTQNPDMWKCPIDQSAFDHHVSKEMVMIMLKCIKSLIARRAFGIGKDDLLKMMDNIAYALDGGDVLYEDLDGTKHKVIYQNGILSGWQWTAFLDTIANIAERLMALELLRSKGIHMDSGYFNAQGDDQYSEFRTAVQCVAYWAALTSMGFELHLQKNFFSNQHNEYLRKCSSENQVNGYPARLVQSILWVYPGSHVVSDKIEKLKNITSNWVKMSERLRVPFSKVMNHYKRDCRGAKIESQLVDMYLVTAKTNGGSGLQGTQTGSKIEKLPDEKKPVKINGRGLHEFRLRFGEFQTRELDSWARSVIGLANTVKLGDQEVVLFEGGPSEVVKTQELKEIPIIVQSNVRIQMLKHAEGWSNELIFGSSRELAEHIFPGFEKYVSFSHAPRKWIFDLLTGRLKVNVPRIPGYSEEFASLIFSPYKNSVIAAMSKKQTRANNKWDSIQLYVERNFHNFVNLRTLPTMMG